MLALTILMDQFLAVHSAEAQRLKTRLAHNIAPIQKECDGAEAVILFVTTDEVNGTRLYTTRAAVQTNGGIVFAMPQNSEVGSLGARKGAADRFARFSAPELYYSWASGALVPKFDFSGSHAMAQRAESNPVSKESKPKKPGRPKDMKNTFAAGSTYQWAANKSCPIAGLTPGVDIDWKAFQTTGRIRVPEEPDHTVEEVDRERPWAKDARTATIRELFKMGMLANPLQYEQYLEGDSDKEKADTHEKAAEKSAQEAGEKLAPRITPRHPAGQTLIKNAIVRVQDGSFTYIGEVMEWLDRMGLEDFKEADMIDLLKARSISIEP